MPITVGPDPKNPGGWIWIDGATGKPAVQPGGPGTPFVAPSDLTPEQQQTITAKQQQDLETARQAGLPPIDPSLQTQVLGAAGRAGWQVVGRTQEVKNQAQVDPKTGVSTTQLTPTQNEVWAISGPNGLNDTVTVQKAGDTYQVVEPPKNLPTSTALPKTPNEETTVIGGQVYGPDPTNPNGPWISRAIDQATQAKANADVVQTLGSANLSNAQAQALMSKTPAEIASVLATTNLTAAQQQSVLNNINIANAKLPSDIAASQAQAAQANAQAGSLASATQIAGQKAGPEIAEIQARTDLSVQQKNELIQKIRQANAPTTDAGTLATGYQSYAQTNPNTGQVTFQQNPNYTPVTQAQVAARVGQLHTLMQGKQQEVQGKVGQFVDGKQYTAQDALNDFNGWYDQNVAPQQQSLQAAQDDAMLQRAKDQASMRQSAMTSALGAGTQNISAFNAMVGANPVGAGYADVMDLARQGKMPTGQQMKDAFTYQAPNPMESANTATQQAYQNLLGNQPPPPQAIDIPGMLNRTNYGGPPGGMPPPPAQGPPPPVALPPPPGISMSPNPINMPQMPGFGGGGQSTPLPNTANQAIGAAGAGVGDLYANPWGYAPPYMYS